MIPVGLSLIVVNAIFGSAYGWSWMSAVAISCGVGVICFELGKIDGQFTDNLRKRK
jgi:hypothetical protein